MNCPSCGSLRTAVRATRRQSTNDRAHMEAQSKRLLKGNVIVRRRECLAVNCRTQFWTVEQIRYVAS